jgi:hypothetical protein
MPLLQRAQPCLHGCEPPVCRLAANLYRSAAYQSTSATCRHAAACLQVSGKLSASQKAVLLRAKYAAQLRLLSRSSSDAVCFLSLLFPAAPGPATSVSSSETALLAANFE